jgi:iron complex outermembrane recepter protein
MNGRMTLVACALSLSATPCWAQATDASAESDDQEIIVTATLRNESLQQVPIAVTAFTGENLERSGVRDLRGLSSVSPSFNLTSSTSQSGGSILRVRGVGTTGNNTGLESSVGLFLDGVYLSRPGVALGDLLDVSQIELLRGPQGTLFGRNTTAGAISIKTEKPNLEKFTGYATATYGNYDLANIQAGVSVPIVEGSLGARLSGAYRRRDGFVRSVSGGETSDRNRFLIRGQLYWEPNADVSLRIIGDYAETREHCCDAVVVRDSSYADAGLYAVSGLPANGGVSVSGLSAVDSALTNTDGRSKDNSDQYGFSAQLEAKLGAVDLTYIGAYRHFRAQPALELDFVGARVISTSNTSSTSTANSAEAFTRINTLTQELRAAGALLDGKLEFLVGGYYSDERIREVQSFTLGADYQAYISAALTSLGVPGPNPARNIFAAGVDATGSYANNLFTQNARNWSLFTNNTFRFSDTFSLNVGARYSNDRKTGQFAQLSANSPACSAVLGNLANLPASLAQVTPLAIGLTCISFTTQANYPGAGTPALPTPFPYANVFKDSQLVYTGKLAWKPSPDINTYLSFTHGYKSGGFNLDPTAAAGGSDPRFNSEKVDAYEFGIKTKLLNRKLTANLAVFYQDIADYQALQFTGLQFATINVPRSSSKGFELELNAAVSKDLSFTGAVTYTDARSDKACGNANSSPTVALLCGEPFTNAPKWVAIAGVDYEREIGSNLTFAFNGSIRMESDRRTDSLPRLYLVGGSTILNPLDYQDGNAKVNLRTAIGSANGRWKLEFWGTNVFDVRTRGISFNLPFRGISSLPGPLNANAGSVGRASFLEEPRTYGVTLKSTF